MPKTEMKVKSGKKYPVNYRVAGSLSDLTRDQVESLAVKYLRNSARGFCVQKLNEAEPAIVVNQTMKAAMINGGLANEEQATAFFASMNMPLSIPSQFEIPLSELVPDGESGRGKKAADLFAFGETEEEEDEEEV